MKDKRKMPISEKPSSHPVAIKSAILFLIGMFFCQYAKNSPLFQTDRQNAFARAKNLDNGISISWLDQTWNDKMLDKDGITDADLDLLKQIGFKTIRLPVAFEYLEEKHVPRQKVLECIDKAWQLCRKHHFRLIVDYHYGSLNDQNFVPETKTVINTWLILAQKYLNKDYDNLFFEIYNEPPPINPQIWKDAAYNIVSAIHKVDRRRTLLVGASNYNSIYELSRLVRLADENIIYTFHFYEPFLFTHQGAAWVGNQVATVGVPFPYNAEKFPQLNQKAKGTAGEQNYNKYRLDGNEASVHDKLLIVKHWADKYQIPIICTEYGCYNEYADPDSRCRYLKCVRANLKTLNIPGVLWDYNTNFSIFTGIPAIKTLPDCMKNAIGYYN
ncbi:aryl-phospho-beta-D-glucosidase BglC (GH1 family) [Mucilaginibacter yixingensis]|uniref:Aryl-phospho-beta-D-glucosidase BglC (GH1 family) n=1 Tax=Mucilaginibacter yixingensis TaxID=1295612 RepID=A0A2T5J4X1_9SPHI|nr:cellulase family glycosylhydrolase [Mucilaginibacter yixingensis]PTQ92876.1 aryl-phospho-beta-D-glucosidase BglC (GH1 family) [Mucilaginibacter yixingensis]